ncbi:MAG: DUF4199 domain-containing protein [Salinivirgaceae bacterium]|jgi:hypothetical protein|nr:DUF4199 domain-containing protein [Salinivirgaceae bacterium]
MNKETIMNFSAKLGAYVGGGFIVTYLLIHVLQGTLHTSNDFSGNITLIILIAGIIIAIRKYRGTKTHFPYADAFKVGFFTSMFAAILGSFFLYIYYSFISPEAIDQYLVLQQNVMLASGMQEGQVEQFTNLMQGMLSPGMMAIFGLVGNLFLGLIISLIAAAFLKRNGTNPNAFDQSMSEIKED